jgi:hypothetical protein
MQRHSTLVLTVAALAFVLVACEAIVKEPPRKDVPTPAVAQKPTKVYVAGTPINELEIAELRRRLSAFEAFDLRDEAGRNAARDVLERFDKGARLEANVREAFEGFGGPYVRLALEVALSEPPRPKVELAGLITHYRFNRYNDSGYLEVDTKATLLVDGNPIRMDDYTWWIAVEPGAYSVHERREDQPDDPFPGTIPLPASAVQDVPGSIWDRNLTHKLFAEGEGIVVLGVVKNGHLLPKAHPFYTTTDTSCIDLLFDGPPPRETLPEQRAYCLGRCEHPWVVNTGI